MQLAGEKCCTILASAFSKDVQIKLDSGENTLPIYAMSDLSATPNVIVNPRRACARVTVLVLCVCVSVYPSVPALAASASVETSKQRYSRVSLRLFLD